MLAVVNLPWASAIFRNMSLLVTVSAHLVSKITHILWVSSSSTSVAWLQHLCWHIIAFITSSCSFSSDACQVAAFMQFFFVLFQGQVCFKYKLLNQLQISLSKPPHGKPYIRSVLSLQSMYVLCNWFCLTLIFFGEIWSILQQGGLGCKYACIASTNSWYVLGWSFWWYFHSCE